MCVSKRVYTVRTKDGYYGKFLCNCGKCLECLHDISEQWAFRCEMEAEYYKIKHNLGSCCLTLSYADTDGELCKKDITNFMKLLRYYIGKEQKVKITYFLSGEYGSVNARPHYHVMVFGYCPKDLYFWKKGKRGSIQYRSPFIEKIWTKGFSTVGTMSHSTAFYSCKYLQKMSLFESKKTKPFVHMSKKDNMIGYRYFKEFCALDEYGKFYYKGVRRSAPRTFLKDVDEVLMRIIRENKYKNNQFLLEQDAMWTMADLKRMKKSIERQNSYEVYRKKAVLPIGQNQEKVGQGRFD